MLQVWIDEVCKLENLLLLLIDYMVCELKVVQNVMLLVCCYVVDKVDVDELLVCLKLYEDFIYCWGLELDFVILYKWINKSVMLQIDDLWGCQLLDSMILLIKEELYYFWQVWEMMLVCDIFYVKIIVSNYVCGLWCEVCLYELVMLIDKLICGVYIEVCFCECFVVLVLWLDDDL